MEREILACATELDPEPYHLQRMRNMMAHDVDVAHVIDAALKEGLTGLLYRNLMKAGLLESLDQQHRERLKTLYYTAVQFNLKLVHDLKEVLELLNEKEIQVVLLQGMALLAQIYEDIGLRPLSDIDLWVLPKAYHGLTGILSSLGYEREALYLNIFRKGSTIIDINTHVLGADRIRTRKSLLAIDQEYIYRDAVTIRFEGYEALCLNKYDQVLLLGVHALKHSISRLIWLVDIKGLIADWKTPDWKALTDRAKELGQEKTIAYIGFLLAKLFDFYLPGEFRQLAETERLSFFEKRVLGRRINGAHLPMWAPFFLLSARKTLPKRLSFFVENAFPRPEILRQVFPDCSECKVWELYLKRVLQVIGMMKMS